MLPFASVAAGCAVSCPDGATFARGVDEAHVQAEFGAPDVISETSGDMTRFYQPDDRPSAFWPRDASVSLYYLGENLEVRFNEDGLCGCDAISKERAQTVRWALEARPEGTP